MKMGAHTKLLEQEVVVRKSMSSTKEASHWKLLNWTKENQSN